MATRNKTKAPRKNTKQQTSDLKPGDWVRFLVNAKAAPVIGEVICIHNHVDLSQDASQILKDFGVFPSDAPVVVTSAGTTGLENILDIRRK